MMLRGPNVDLSAGNRVGYPSVAGSACHQRVIRTGKLVLRMERTLPGCRGGYDYVATGRGGTAASGCFHHSTQRRVARSDARTSLAGFRLSA
jgi:hypothetical protein